MPLTKLTVLQIGDVHFPEWKESSSEIDLKVNRFSQTIVSALQTDTLSPVLEGLRDVCRQEPVDAAILMGDFTSVGKTQFIEPAVTVVSGLINDSGAVRQIPIFGVPGNHDVSRDDAVRLGDLGKFQTLQTAFAKAKWGPLPVQTYVEQALSNGAGMDLPLFLLNSSIGSWSKALYPQGMRQLIFADNDEPIKLGDVAPFGDTKIAPIASSLAEQVYEQLDTPYFRAIDIQAIAEKIKAAKAPAIVVAHHNLLPQYTPRISQFGEVLNAGFARQLFLNAGTQILYLHGHIHTDPIEIVRAPGGPAMIVTIAAPVFWKGFNLVTLFQQEGGAPFAAKITQYRMGDNGLGKTSEVIPLMADPTELLRKEVSKFWSHLNGLDPADRGIFNWNELVSHCSRVGIKEAEVEPVLLALYCSGLIEIRNFDASTSAWRVTLRG